MKPDHINACFELGGALLIWCNVRRLYCDKSVRGVFAPVFVFYTLWGFWNCVFYPAVGQTLSFYAGLGTTLGNLTWVALAFVYRTRFNAGGSESWRTQVFGKEWADPAARERWYQEYAGSGAVAPWHVREFANACARDGKAGRP